MRMDFRRVMLACAVVGAALFQPSLGQAQPQIQPPRPGGGGGGGGGQPAMLGPLLQGAVLDQTVQALKDAGYTEVEIYTARSGAKHVSGKVDGLLVSAIHLHCKDDKCPALAFVFNFGQQDTIDAAYMNSWNLARLYARLYKDKEGSLILQQDVLVFDVPLVYIKHTAQMYARLLKEVMQYKPD